MTMQRALQVLVGIALLGYVVYALHTGTLQGKFRQFSRSDDPFSFWFGVLVTAGIGLVCLFWAGPGRR
ncbi:MAG: hypothetical protein JSS29_19995 [Proteobacteria bacterium]|nr:hypothetical protein [Pseudomonadota bacterium]